VESVTISADTRIHELGIAVQTGSTLEDRFFIGAELIEVSYQARNCS
jgi:hypothetical protein